MTEIEFNQMLQKGLVNFLPPQKQDEKKELKPFSLDEYQAIIEALRRPRRHLTDHPTASFVPKSFLDQIQLIDTGSAQYVDVYINGHWYSLSTTLIV